MSSEVRGGLRGAITGAGRRVHRSVTVYDNPERRLRVDRTSVSHHQASISLNPFSRSGAHASHDPGLARAATERAAGRSPRPRPRWYETPPDMAQWWALWSLFMLGFCGYCIDQTEWYGVALFAIFTVAALVPLTFALRVRRDETWLMRVRAQRLRTQPDQALKLAGGLIRDHGDNPEALAAVAGWAYDADRWPDAIQAYSRYLGQVDGDVFARARLVDVQLHAGDGEAANAVLDSLEGRQGIDAARDLLARRMMARLIEGDTVTALALASPLPPEADLDAGDRDQVRYLAALAQSTVDPEAAVAVLDQLATAHPRHPRFAAIRDAVREGTYRMSLSDVLDCSRVSDEPLVPVATQRQPLPQPQPADR